MKATLEFNLPEESEEHNSAINGWKYQLILEEIFNYLRRQEKIGNTHLNIEDIRSAVVEIRDQQGVY
jgi:hypothetical protein